MSITSTASAAAARLNSDADRIIGTNVHMLIWNRGETQTEVARALGLEKSALGLKLRGKRPWYAAEIDAVARRYGVAPGSLFNKLPDLDSNQEPIGSQPGAVVSLAERRTLRMERAS